MSGNAIKTMRGELPLESRPTEKEKDDALAILKAKLPKHTILLDERGGGNIRITILAPGNEGIAFSQESQQTE